MLIATKSEAVGLGKSKLPWDAPRWVEFYESRRSTTKGIYPSEWFFLKNILVEGIRVLDIGCAVGGLSTVLSEQLTSFQYTGVDISASMIERARIKHPTNRFFVIEEADLSVLGNEMFDLVVCLGVLHLSKKWRELISTAWAHGSVLLFDMRESAYASVEDESISYYQMDTQTKEQVPYNIINCAEAQSTLVDLCAGAVEFHQYGYLANVSPDAVTPHKRVMMNTYKISKRASDTNIKLTE